MTIRDNYNYICFRRSFIPYHIYLISYYMNLLLRKLLPYYLPGDRDNMYLSLVLIMGIISIWVAISHKSIFIMEEITIYYIINYFND